MAGVDAHHSQEREGLGIVASVVPGRLIGLHGHLARPFWGVIGMWAVLCGALASQHALWTRQSLQLLALVLLITEVGWGSLWDLSTGVDWLQLLRQGGPSRASGSLRGLPYTQPSSSAGRLLRGYSRLAHWFQRRFWPTAGSALLGCLAAGGLTCILALFLPDRLHLLYAALAGLVLVGALFRRAGKPWLAGQGLVQVGLGWIAGHMTFADWSVPSLVLAVAFTLAVWGTLRAMHRLAGSFWLVNGGQAVACVLLVWLEKPLAAGLVGLVLLGQVAFQFSLRLKDTREPNLTRSWLWVMVAMLVAVLALP